MFANLGLQVERVSIDQCVSAGRAVEVLVFLWLQLCH